MHIYDQRGEGQEPADRAKHKGNRELRHGFDAFGADAVAAGAEEQNSKTVRN